MFGDGAPARRIVATLGQLESVEAVGPYEVKLTWAAPDYIIPHRLSNKGSWIVQASAYRPFEKDGVEDKVWMGEAVDAVTWNPTGTGPLYL
ncbi:MAG: hypothetical protein OXL68_03835 [Paracoccaceae bacterium]|nr:hypothetical protein [Paracoccaceae bacterium]